MCVWMHLLCNLAERYVLLVSGEIRLLSAGLDTQHTCCLYSQTQTTNTSTLTHTHCWWGLVPSSKKTTFWEKQMKLQKHFEGVRKCGRWGQQHLVYCYFLRGNIPETLVRGCEIWHAQKHVKTYVYTQQQTVLNRRLTGSHKRTLIPKFQQCSIMCNYRKFAPHFNP